MSEVKSVPCLYGLDEKGLPGSWWKAVKNNVVVCCSNSHQLEIPKNQVSDEGVIERFRCSKAPDCSYKPSSVKLEGYKQHVAIELKKTQKETKKSEPEESE